MTTSIKSGLAIILLTLSIQASGNGATYWSSLCTKSDRKSHRNFLELPDKKAVAFDIFKAFIGQRKLGEGSFGLVRKVAYINSAGLTESIAVKKMHPKRLAEYGLIKNELNIMNDMSGSSYFPRLYGCAYNDNDELMMGMTLMSHNLGTNTFRDFLAAESNHNSLKIHRQLFQGMRDLWNKGYAHNDFKPDNAMIDSTNTEVRIIDLGLGESNRNYNSPRGTPYYMSPDKFTGKNRIGPKDDMYSIAVSIAVMEAPKAEDDIFTSHRIVIERSCFLKRNTVSCREKIIANVKRVFEALKYGKFQEVGDRTNINFTTLICRMIEYDNFHYDYDTVLGILDRLIKETGSRDLKLEENEVEEKLKMLEAKRRHDKRLEDLEKKEVAIKREMEDRQRGILDLQKEAKKVKKEEHGAKLEEDFNAKLGQLRRENQDKKKELRAVEEQAREQARIIRRVDNKGKFDSKVFRENKDLFNPVLGEEKVTFDPEAEKNLEKEMAEREMIHKAKEKKKVLEKDPYGGDKVADVGLMFKEEAQKPQDKDKLFTKDRLPLLEQYLGGLHKREKYQPTKQNQSPAFRAKTPGVQRPQVMQAKPVGGVAAYRAHGDILAQIAAQKYVGKQQGFLEKNALGLNTPATKGYYGAYHKYDQNGRRVKY